MNHTVCITVNGFVEVCVEASNAKEASEKACKIVEEYDFGALRGVEWNTSFVTDADGNQTDAEDL